MITDIATKADFEALITQNPSICQAIQSIQEDEFNKAQKRACRRATALIEKQMVLISDITAIANEFFQNWDELT